MVLSGKKIAALMALVVTSSAFAINNPPVKKIAIYNNSNESIYPVIEAPAQPIDHWLQAQFQTTDIKNNTYQHTKIYRVYVNPTDGGIPPGQSVTLSVPFYSDLARNPNPALADQYIDWWGAMRVYLYDGAAALTKAYDVDKINRVSLLTVGLSCDAGSACAGALDSYASTVGLPLNDPYQLTEYTFADVVTNQGAPFPIAYDRVDYDLSYVDHVYLPAAMEPYANNTVGFTGSIWELTHFRTIMDQFIAATGWPVYTSTIPLPYNKIPGTYNVITGTQSLTSNSVLDNTEAHWNACKTSDINCQNVDDLFTKNYNNYQIQCQDSSPVMLSNYLLHIYGWVPFECEGHPNDLVSTPSANYNQAASSYHALQYSGAFNDYVQLIHSQDYLDMSAYAYSIDDAVGNMNEEGDGIVIAVGGSTGLPNPKPFKKETLANVDLGWPLSGTVWSAYGICRSQPDTQLTNGNKNFQIQAVNYPCEISLMDTSKKIYHFTLLKEPPFVGSNKYQYLQCDAGDVWCNAINIDFTTHHDIDTPEPSILHSH